jgi:hypothetical protein
MPEQLPQQLNTVNPENPEKGTVVSPEVEKKILEKVSNIFSYGTAYTSIIKPSIPVETPPGVCKTLQEQESAYTQNPRNLENLFKNGVLGTVREDGPQEETKAGLELGEVNRKLKEVGKDKPEEIWREHVRRKKQVSVSFNIQGRSFRGEFIAPNEPPPKYEEVPGGSGGKPSRRIGGGISYLSVSPLAYFRGLAVIFDINDLKEEPPLYQPKIPVGDEKWYEWEKAHKRIRDFRETSEWRKYCEKGKINTYRIRTGRKIYVSSIPNEHGDLCTTNEYGFSLSSRVAPRRFRGLVCDEIHFQKVLPIMLETYKDKPDLLVPIYDETGNLLWPKKMSFDEVKRAIEDKNKK